MLVKIALASGVFFFVTPAFASEAMDKCVADTTALGAKDPETQCQCFVDAISEETANDYAQISNWETEATDEMKKAGVACFPDIN